MNILVGCETSGVVRRAFAANGHDVWSVDLLPSEDGSNRHIIGDLRDHLHDGWDLLAVMHPPCTRLCNSGVRWLHVPPPGRTKEEMWADLDAAASFFSDCLNAPIPRVCVENPIMHSHARKRIGGWIKPQTVQPWWFGEPAFKATCLYLRGLSPLVATDRLVPPASGTAEHKAWSQVHRASPGPDRWKNRSRTYAGVARAMATQWAPAALQEAAE
ncbi:hypothetical protein [Xanthobacter aminoxidans]|uniref:hypothetical protein n=1 Tax=Xanthobacter aminoxidans TaxID=186280 RepID=UPI002022ECE2|nr:hypothetical protein [Xanthobacter aminoxidans]